MTKNELKQIFRLNNELKMWKEESQQLQDRIETCGKWLDGMPRGTEISDKVGNLATELANCKLMIACKEMEIQMQKARAIKYIDGIKDSLMRQIIFYRCVSCMGWERVAKEVGGGATYHSVRMAFNRHFKDGEEK